jgi:hypothetical protein
VWRSGSIACLQSARAVIDVRLRVGRMRNGDGKTRTRR